MIPDLILSHLCIQFSASGTFPFFSLKHTLVTWLFHTVLRNFQNWQLFLSNLPLQLDVKNWQPTPNVKRIMQSEIFWRQWSTIQHWRREHKQATVKATSFCVQDASPLCFTKWLLRQSWAHIWIMKCLKFGWFWRVHFLGEKLEISRNTKVCFAFF